MQEHLKPVQRVGGSTVANNKFETLAVAVSGYKEKCGSWPNPVTTDMVEASLGGWLSECRAAFDADTLSVEQLEILNSRIPGWYTKVGPTWENRAKTLSSYLLENGSLPDRSHWLHQWLTVQSGLARCGFLGQEKVQWIRNHCLGLSDFGAPSAPLWKIG